MERNTQDIKLCDADLDKIDAGADSAKADAKAETRWSPQPVKEFKDIFTPWVQAAKLLKNHFGKNTVYYND
jgi:hypothetical protein